jgi:CubicO group peptidase (beta-lactamase class C family)
MKTRLLVLCLILLIPSCKEKNKSESAADEPIYLVDSLAIKRLDSTLQTYVDSGKIAGISTLVFEKNKEVYFNAFGSRNIEQQKPMERNTIVQIYSMTKPITGTALMTLYEKGKFQLDDPLEKYAPEFSNMKVYVGEDAAGNPILEDVKRPITIRDITRHTAGFGNSDLVPEGLQKMIDEADALNGNNTLTQMAEKLGNTPLLFHPGEQWEYGPSVDVQAFMVERISGVPFLEYVRKNVLDPLKMTDTRYVVPEEDRDRFSAMFVRNDEGLSQQDEEESQSMYYKYWPLTRGGWGLTSTLDDYQRFARMLVNKGTFENVTILQPVTVELMATNHLDETIEKRSWLPSKGQVGFGIDFAVRLRPPSSPEENNGVVGEFFWDGAASTLFWVDPVNEITVVMFVQLFPYDGIGLHKSIRDAVYGPVAIP